MNETRPFGHPVSPQQTLSRKANKTNRLACDICRERKVRCDRDWPQCGRCARLGDDCSYKGKSRCNEAQEDLPRQLKLLQDRLSQAEERLAQQQPSQAQPLIPHTAPPPAAATEQTPLSALELGPVTPPAPWESIALSEPNQYQIRPSSHLELFTQSQFNINDLDILDNGVLKGSLPFPEAELDWLNTADLGFGKDDAGSIISQRHRLSRHPSPGNPGKAIANPPIVPRSRANSTVHSVRSSAGGEGTPSRPLSSTDLTRLQNLYFEIVYPTIPILPKDHFFAHIRQSQEAPQVQALSYAVALMGSMVSQEHQVYQEVCLGHVRHYVEICEREEDMPMLLSLDLFQALIFLTRFELTHRMIVRAWMTVGLAVRLSNILHLHLQNPHIEGSRRVHGGLPPTTDPMSIEMRRRSFWSLYICETYASSRAGMSPLLQEEQITIPLPSPGNLDSDFEPTNMPTLTESYTMTDPKNSNLSSFSAVVLACAIARRCPPHADRASTNSPTTSSSPTSGFWARHFSLLTLLEDRTKLLAPHLTVRAVKTDPVAFSLYVYLCGIDISLQEIARAQVEREGFAPVVAADSAQRSRSAAYRLAGTAWATTPRDRNSQDYFALHGAFMARPVATAVQVLGRDLQSPPNGTAVSTIVDCIHLLLGALDRLEERAGFWHESVALVAKAARNWDEAHEDRSADTWAAALFQQIS